MNTPGASYDFGTFRLEPDAARLLRAGEPVHLPPKALDLLIVLVRHAGHVVSKEQLLAEVWAGTFVEDGNLSVHMSTIRRALDDEAGRLIETVPKRGYRFVARISAVPSAVSDAPAAIEHTVPAEPLMEVGPTAPQTAPRMAAHAWPWAIGVGAVVIAITAVALFRASAEVPRSVISLAVLPFQGLEATEDENYLGLGLADAVITQLGGETRLNVRPTEAVRRFTTPTADPIAAGKTLKVDHVLTGFVQRDLRRVRLTVQMVDVRTGRTEWSARFDHESYDLFTLQDTVAAQVADTLLDRVAGTNQMRASGQPATSDAYREYLQGRFFLNQASQDGSQRAVTHFIRAMALDSRFAPAYAGLARAYRLLAIGAVRGMSPHEAMPLARRWAEQALSLDNAQPEALLVLGMVKFQYEWDWSGAEETFRRALALRPNEAAARHNYGWFLTARGQLGDGIRELTRARELDPVSVLIAENLGVALGLAGRPHEALAVLQDAAALDVTLGRPYSRQIAVYEQLGRFDAAFNAWHRALVIGNRLEQANELERAYRAGGYRGAAEFAARFGVANGDAFQATLGYLFLGDLDRALEQLEICYRERHTWLPFLQVDRRFDPLRGDPRFADLLRRLHLAE